MKTNLYFKFLTLDFFLMAVIKPFLSLKRYHVRSLVSLGALWTKWINPNARPMQVSPRNSHIAMKEHMLCQDAGTICASANSYLFKISMIIGWSGKLTS